LRTGASQVGQLVSGSSLNDCTTSNSCLPSALLQTYWYVGTVLALLVALSAGASGLALSPVDCQ
jgi:hypothetical protein